MKQLMVAFYIWQFPDVNTNAGLLRITALDCNCRWRLRWRPRQCFKYTCLVDDWGPLGVVCQADLEGDTVENMVDLLLVIASW